MSNQMYHVSSVLEFGANRKEDIFLLGCLQKEKGGFVERINALTIEQNRVLEKLTKMSSLLA